MTDTTPSDDFDAAKAVCDQLKDMDADRRARVLRWVAESLGIALQGSHSAIPGTLSTQPPRAEGAAVPPSGGSTDIKSFIAAKAPKSDNQFAAAVAYYYRFEATPALRRNFIDGDALQEAARLAGRRRLSHPRVTLNNAKSAGYLDSSTPGQFTINSVGENLVAMALPGGVDSKAGSRSRKRSKSAARARRRAKSAD